MKILRSIFLRKKILRSIFYEWSLWSNLASKDIATDIFYEWRLQSNLAIEDIAIDIFAKEYITIDIYTNGNFVRIQRMKILRPIFLLMKILRSIYLEMEIAIKFSGWRYCDRYFCERRYCNQYFYEWRLWSNLASEDIVINISYEWRLRSNLAIEDIAIDIFPKEDITIDIYTKGNCDRIQRMKILQPIFLLMKILRSIFLEKEIAIKFSGRRYCDRYFCKRKLKAIFANEDAMLICFFDLFSFSLIFFVLTPKT